MASRRKRQSEPENSGQPAWRQLPQPHPAARRNQAVVRRKETTSERPAEVAQIRASFRPALKVHVGPRQWMVLLLTVAALSGLWLLGSREWFIVPAGQVTIRGNQRVPADQIYAASQVEGRNVFMIRPAAIAARIDQVPGVASSKARVRLPASVVLDVREYTPLVTWQVLTTTVWLAADGSSVPMVGEAPALILVDPAGAAADETGRLRPKVLEDLKALYASHPELTSIYYGAVEGLYYRSPEGWTVYLGTEGKISRKLALLAGIQREAAAGRVKPDVVDLRFEGQALLK